MFVYVVYFEETLEIIDVLSSEDAVTEIFNTMDDVSGLNWKAINIESYAKSVLKSDN